MGHHKRHRRCAGALTVIRGGARRRSAIGTIIKLARRMRGRGRF